MAGAFKTEDEFVAWIKRRSRMKAPGMRLGIGDDAALIQPLPGRDIILTADLSIEGVHFSAELHRPEEVGHRALARSLSDVAAMGGRPRFALVSLGLSKPASRPWVEKFYRGLFGLARRFGVAVIGGDTALTPGGTAIDVTLVGDALRGAALLRSGARPGDAVFIAGTPGLSALGLLMLRSRVGMRHGPALRAHLQPEPQCRLGLFLSEQRLASAAIDLSDGLSLDLRRLARASGVGAILWAAAIPLVKPEKLHGLGNVSPLALALEGGEDYKLLFTVPRSKFTRLPESFEGTRLYGIGEIFASRRGRVMIDENGRLKPLAATGYDHFRSR